MHPEIDGDIFETTGSSRESTERRGTSDGSGVGEDAKEDIDGTKKRIAEFFRIIYEQSAIVQQEWRCKTAKELFILWQSKVIYDWHHTTSLRVIHLDMKKVSYNDLHPYLKSPSKVKKPIGKKKPLFRDKLRE